MDQKQQKCNHSNIDGRCHIPYTSQLNADNHCPNVQFVAAPYKPQEYFQAVRGLEKEPEGGDRCKACFLVFLPCRDHLHHDFIVIDLLV